MLYHVFIFSSCDMKLGNTYQHPNFVRFPLFQCLNVALQLFCLKL